VTTGVPSHLQRTHTSRKDETRRCSLHFIRDHIEKGMIDVEYCPTENTPTDVITKGLTCEIHERLLRLMGVGLCEETAMPS